MVKQSFQERENPLNLKFKRSAQNKNKNSNPKTKRSPPKKPKKKNPSSSIPIFFCSEMDFFAMTRKELQSLCKKHGIRANLKNIEMAERLTLLFKEDEKSGTEVEPQVVVVDSLVESKKSKKVKFSPENQTFYFVATDNEADTDCDYDPKKKRGGGRKSMGKKVSEKKESEEIVLYNVKEIKRNDTRKRTRGKNSEGAPQLVTSVEAAVENEVQLAKPPLRRSRRKTTLLSSGASVENEFAICEVEPVTRKSAAAAKPLTRSSRNACKMVAAEMCDDIAVNAVEKALDGSPVLQMGKELERDVTRKRRRNKDFGGSSEVEPCLENEVLQPKGRSRRSNSKIALLTELSVPAEISLPLGEPKIDVGWEVHEPAANGKSRKKKKGLSKKIESALKDQPVSVALKDTDKENIVEQNPVASPDKLSSVVVSSGFACVRGDVQSFTYRPECEGQTSNILDLNEGLESEESLIGKSISRRGGELEEQLENSLIASVSEDQKSVGKIVMVRVDMDSKTPVEAAAETVGEMHLGSTIHSDTTLTPLDSSPLQQVVNEVQAECALVTEEVLSQERTSNFDGSVLLDSHNADGQGSEVKFPAFSDVTEDIEEKYKDESYGERTEEVVPADNESIEELDIAQTLPTVIEEVNEGIENSSNLDESALSDIHNTDGQVTADVFLNKSIVSVSKEVEEKCETLDIAQMLPIVVEEGTDKSLNFGGTVLPDLRNSDGHVAEENFLNQTIVNTSEELKEKSEALDISQTLPIVVDEGFEIISKLDDSVFPDSVNVYGQVAEDKFLSEIIVDAPEEVKETNDHESSDGDRSNTFAERIMDKVESGTIPVVLNSDGDAQNSSSCGDSFSNEEFEKGNKLEIQGMHSCAEVKGLMFESNYQNLSFDGKIAEHDHIQTPTMNSNLECALDAVEVENEKRSSKGLDIVVRVESKGGMSTSQSDLLLDIINSGDSDFHKERNASFAIDDMTHRDENASIGDNIGTLDPGMENRMLGSNTDKEDFITYTEDNNIRSCLTKGELANLSNFDHGPVDIEYIKDASTKVILSADNSCTRRQLSSGDLHSSKGEKNNLKEMEIVHEDLGNECLDVKDEENKEGACKVDEILDAIHYLNMDKTANSKEDSENLLIIHKGVAEQDVGQSSGGQLEVTHCENAMDAGDGKEIFMKDDQYAEQSILKDNEEMCSETVRNQRANEVTEFKSHNNMNFGSPDSFDVHRHNNDAADITVRKENTVDGTTMVEKLIGGSLLEAKSMSDVSLPYVVLSRMLESVSGEKVVEGLDTGLFDSEEENHTLNSEETEEIGDFHNIGTEATCAADSTEPSMLKPQIGNDSPVSASIYENKASELEAASPILDSFGMKALFKDDQTSGHQKSGQEMSKGNAESEYVEHVKSLRESIDSSQVLEEQYHLEQKVIEEVMEPKSAQEMYNHCLTGSAVMDTTVSSPVVDTLGMDWLFGDDDEVKKADPKMSEDNPTSEEVKNGNEGVAIPQVGSGELGGSLSKGKDSSYGKSFSDSSRSRKESGLSVQIDRGLKVGRLSGLNVEGVIVGVDGFADTAATASGHEIKALEIVASPGFNSLGMDWLFGEDKEAKKADPDMSKDNSTSEDVKNGNGGVAITPVGVGERGEHKHQPTEEILKLKSPQEFAIHCHPCFHVTDISSLAKLDPIRERSREEDLEKSSSVLTTTRQNKNQDFFIPRTPKNLIMESDMKENLNASKSEHVRNITSMKPLHNRRPLEDLKNK